MIRATTPTLVLTLTGDNTLDITQADNVYVTMMQFGEPLTKTGEDLELTAKTITLHLTQQETLLFVEDVPVSIQINWIADGERFATPIHQITVGRQLLSEVMPHVPD